MNDYKKKTVLYYGKRRSLIRTIVALLPNWLFSPPPRIVLQIPIQALDPEANVEYEQECSDDDAISYSSDENLVVGRSHVLSPSKPDLVKTYTGNEETASRKLSELEKQLNDLRKQVSEILEGVKCGHSRSYDDVISPGPVVTFLRIDTSPPPPPPMPTISFNQTPLKTVAKTVTSTPVLKPITMSDILKDMDKIKLRPVQRSPGGRPVRDLPPSDVNHDLQTILKRRYSAMHTVSPHSPKNSQLISSDSFTE